VECNGIHDTRSASDSPSDSWLCSSLHVRGQAASDSLSSAACPCRSPPSLVPGLSSLSVEPDLVFFVFLPPVLWSAAYFTSWRDFRNNARPITLLPVGLVLVTTAAVALCAALAYPRPRLARSCCARRDRVVARRRSAQQIRRARKCRCGRTRSCANKLLPQRHRPPRHPEKSRSRAAHR